MRTGHLPTLLPGQALRHGRGALLINLLLQGCLDLSDPLAGQLALHPLNAQLREQRVVGDSVVWGRMFQVKVVAIAGVVVP